MSAEQKAADLAVQIEVEKNAQIEEATKARFEAEKDEAEKGTCRPAQNLANKRVADVINEGERPRRK